MVHSDKNIGCISFDNCIDFISFSADYKNIYNNLVNIFTTILYNLCIMPGNSIYT